MHKPGQKHALAVVALLVVAAPLSQITTPASAGPAGARNAAAGSSAATARGGDQRPNIVLITTDDQRLRDLEVMPRTKRLLQTRGTRFAGISPHPLCCPARAELLTGQYAHNNGVRSNRGPYGGYKNLDPSQTIATWLRDAGYTTIFLGKYLNGYGRDDAGGKEAGWASWHPTVGRVYGYQRFSVSHNGVEETIRSYQTDYFTDLATRQIRRYASSKRPFFLWQSYIAPHGTCLASEEERCWTAPGVAPRHRGLFQDEPLDTRRSPAFNERDMSDKPSRLQDVPPLTREERRKLVDRHRKRLESLQAVDEGVADTIAALRRAGELRNTLVIFTSDNGFLLGEHRLHGKTYGYEPSLEVPLLMRGPGVPDGRRTGEVATTIDIPATIVAASEANPTLPLDGQDLRLLANGTVPGTRTQLIQGGPRNKVENAVGWFYRGVRTPRYTYIVHAVTGEVELYDRRKDPHQIDSVHAEPAYAVVRAELDRRLRALQDCAGESCIQDFGPVPRPL